MKNIIILVEGQTEETFVNSLLRPFLLEKNILITPTILITKKSKHGSNFVGGIRSYGQVKRDIDKLIKDKSIYITTFFDFYGLPTDFPKYGNSMKKTTSLEKVCAIENDFFLDINCSRFIPYIQIHEFEALLFSSVNGFQQYFNSKELVDEINNIRNEFYDNPEDINNSPHTAPSKRLIELFDYYLKINYEKEFHGNLIALENKLYICFEKCPHFTNWIKKLIDLPTLT